MRAAYTLDSEYGTFEFYLEGLDLLRGPEDPNIQRSRGDDDVYITEADYLGGTRQDLWQLVPRYHRLSAAEEKAQQQGD